MINEYTMKQIEFRYNVGGAITFQDEIKKIKKKYKKARRLPQSVFEVKKLDEFIMNSKAVRAFFDILDYMQSIDIVGLATTNSKLYLNEAEKVQVTEVLDILNRIRLDLSLSFFNKILKGPAFGASPTDRRKFWQSIWPQVQSSFTDIKKPEWLTQQLVEDKFQPLIRAAHKSLVLSYKPVEEKIYSWGKGFPNKGKAKFYKPATYDRDRKEMNKDINDFITNFPPRR